MSMSFPLQTNTAKALKKLIHGIESIKLRQKNKGMEGSKLISFC